ncbi:hypothetical protein BDZ91DRAFT_164217 [Kalaharituber pfeilii]|nr:hypothetical protein BDZ91DRAFT_164217 [Kalaharituber pfeilii]
MKLGGHRMDLWTLDNTGSTFLELFALDDLPSLGIDPLYNAWGHWAPLATSNGIVWRRLVIVEVNIPDDQGALLTNWKAMWATVTPGPAMGNSRCSGMFLRQSLYTGTAPDGRGILYIAATRGGVCSRMPVL